jgi:hypothetical protein
MLLGMRFSEGLPEFLSKFFRVICKYTLPIFTSHILFALGALDLDS